MKKCKKLVPVLLALALLVSCGAPALACTGLYVGGGISANGSTYMGRSEDISGKHTKIFGFAPAADYPADYVYEDTKGFSYPFGGHTYAYIYCKDSPEFKETMTDGQGNYIFEAYAEAGQNEKGVSMTATVTTSYNNAAKAADPRVKGGLAELSIGTLILSKAATAKEGVELLAKIIDEKGSAECNSIMIADPNETWYFEQLSGHQYAAVKLPADKASVQPNLSLLGVIDVTDTENVVASAALVSLAQENGFLVTDESGKINVAKTYGSSSINSSRYYQGLYYLNKAAAEALGWKTAVNENGKTVVVNAAGETVNGADPLNGVELLHDTDHALTTLEVLQLLAYQGAGLEGFDSNVSGVSAIGNTRTSEAHVFEVRQDMPLELTTLEWLALSPADFSIYLPSYSAVMTEVDPLFDETALQYAENSLFWVFSQLNTLCSGDRTNYGANVKSYFAQYQQSLIDQQAAVDAGMLELYNSDPAALSAAANALHASLAQQVYQMADGVLKELEAYIAAGDTAEPFLPTAAAAGTMPVYSLAAALAAPGAEESSGQESTPAPETAPGQEEAPAPEATQEPAPTAGTEPAPETTPALAAVPETGDTASAWVLLALAAALSLAALPLLKKKAV